jgi:CheY-like chemotaxis protein
VRQILANFLSNALKFTERGSVALRLSAATEERVRVEVQDSGVGVPDTLRERLFEPFVQADSSTTRRYGGSGLGLSICRELAQRMDGAVGVDSDGRSGSCFWAELRLPAAALPAPVPAAPGHAAAAPLAGLRLLVAEDNPVNRLIVCTLLQRLGAEVLEAEDGAQAVAIAQREAATLHAVLMDLHMPVVDGLAATRALHADARTAALPVLALSAAVLAHERAEAAAAGMVGFIAKPVEEAELLRLLGPLAAAAR